MGLNARTTRGWIQGAENRTAVGWLDIAIGPPVVPPALPPAPFGPQSGDVLLFQTDAGGDIIVERGLAQMTEGFETAAYLSLFGGNEIEAGAKDILDWWGNLEETDPDKRYISETQYLLHTVPANSASLLRLEEAARRDLDWLLSSNIASSVVVLASIPEINKLDISIAIEAEGEITNFTFTENWKAIV